MKDNKLYYHSLFLSQVCVHHGIHHEEGVISSFVYLLPKKFYLSMIYKRGYCFRGDMEGFCFFFLFLSSFLSLFSLSVLHVFCSCLGKELISHPFFGCVGKDKKSEASFSPLFDFHSPGRLI